MKLAGIGASASGSNLGGNTCIAGLAKLRVAPAHHADTHAALSAFLPPPKQILTAGHSVASRAHANDATGAAWRTLHNRDTKKGYAIFSAAGTGSMSLTALKNFSWIV